MNKDIECNLLTFYIEFNMVEFTLSRMTMLSSDIVKITLQKNNIILILSGRIARN